MRRAVSTQRGRRARPFRARAPSCGRRVDRDTCAAHGRSQRGRKLTILPLQGIVASGVEPEVRSVAAECPCNRPRAGQEGCLRVSPRARDRRSSGSVPPARTRTSSRRAELLRRLHRDVQRPVAAFGQPADARAVRDRDCSVARVDRVHDVAGTNVRQPSYGPTPFAHSLSVNVPVDPNGITRMSG